jgi:hypothetical protein
MSDPVSDSFSRASTGQTLMRFGVEIPWSIPPASLRDVHFLRSWLELDSELDQANARRRSKWYPVIGMALTIGVSATFWTSIGLIVMRFWK